MTVHRKKSAFLTLACALVLASGTLGANCDGVDDPVASSVDTSCKAGVAQILILDGMSKRLCGCNEAGNTLIVTPNTLTCTVPAGTKVFFHFTAARLRHQLVPVGGTSFPASPIYDPDGYKGSFVLDASAAATTYGYKDQFDATISGQIVSQ